MQKVSSSKILRFLKPLWFSDSNYAIDKETGKSVSGLVDTLGLTLLMCPSKN